MCMFETSDLDHQGKICLESLNICAIPNYSVLITYIIQVQNEFETGALDLDYHAQNGL